jgi:hypothetical protein
MESGFICGWFSLQILTLSYRHSKKGIVAAMQHRQIATGQVSTTILAKTVMRLFYRLAGMRALSRV